MDDCTKGMTMTPNEITLKLTKQEALVLFEWLAKLEAMGTTVFQHPSEEKVLWKLQGQLESTLQEPFAANYADIVAEARKTVESGGT
jgi:predicted DNA-binding transcriptional regulator YafY